MTLKGNIFNGIKKMAIHIEVGAGLYHVVDICIVYTLKTKIDLLPQVNYNDEGTSLIW